MDIYSTSLVPNRPLYSYMYLQKLSYFDINREIIKLYGNNYISTFTFAHISPSSNNKRKIYTPMWLLNVLTLKTSTNAGVKNIRKNQDIFQSDTTNRSNAGRETSSSVSSAKRSKRRKASFVRGREGETPSGVGGLPNSQVCAIFQVRYFKPTNTYKMPRYFRKIEMRWKHYWR